MPKPMSDLKSAIQGLKINTPFDLRKQGQVTLSPPQPEPPRVEAPRNEAPKIEPSRAALPQTEVPPTPEPPRIEAPRRNGFFRLSHAVFADPELRNLSGDSFRLFIWMSTVAWRYQDSDGTLRASISYMEAGTGVSHATVSRALAQLKSSGLVKLVQTDFKKGNVWQVSKRALYVPDPEGPQSKGPRNDEPPPSKRGSSDLNPSERPTQNEAEVRSSKNSQKEPENSLAGPVESARLRSYLAELRPLRKRESELEAFRELRNDYTEGEIDQCLEYLEEQGVPGSGAPCHSPLAYLAKAMAQILPEAKAFEARRRQAEVREREHRDSEQRRELEEQRAEEETRRREQSFVLTYPSVEEQEKVIERYSSRFPMLARNGPALRSVAIAAWWNDSLSGG